MKKDERIRAMEMTRRIRDQIYEQTKDMSTEELLRFFNERGKGEESLGPHERERQSA